MVAAQKRTMEKILAATPDRRNPVSIRKEMLHNCARLHTHTHTHTHTHNYLLNKYTSDQLTEEWYKRRHCLHVVHSCHSNCRLSTHKYETVKEKKIKTPKERRYRVWRFKVRCENCKWTVSYMSVSMLFGQCPWPTFDISHPLHVSL